MINIVLIPLMEEILHHLGCTKPCKYWEKTTNLNWWYPGFSEPSKIISSMGCIIWIQLHNGYSKGHPISTFDIWPVWFRGMELFRGIPIIVA